jgi:hypothetical protein
MKTPSDVIREMRQEFRTNMDGEAIVGVKRIRGWADGIEASMQWPVAEVYASADSVCGERGTEIDWIGSRRCDPGTKLYCLPPEAAGEIERLKVLLSHWHQCWLDDCDPDSEVLIDTLVALAKEDKP